jgi:hypothetical protein
MVDSESVDAEGHWHIDEKLFGKVRLAPHFYAREARFSTGLERVKTSTSAGS